MLKCFAFFEKLENASLRYFASRLDLIDIHSSLDALQLDGRCALLFLHMTMKTAFVCRFFCHVSLKAAPLLWNNTSETVKPLSANFSAFSILILINSRFYGNYLSEFMDRVVFQLLQWEDVFTFKSYTPFSRTNHTR